MHLIVEADKAALSSGMRGLAIRLALNVNRLVGRKGRVWADRWHRRDLASPRAVRAALVDVLANFKKHHPHSRGAVDRFSSAPYFEGFRELDGNATADVDASFMHQALAPPRRPPVTRPRRWLLRARWLRGGRLSLFETPS